jgi:hypothetical protein
VSNEELIDILRDAMIEIAGEPVPYEGISGVAARFALARQELALSLVRLVQAERRAKS